jgi:sialate O-acetylesterase
MKWYLISFLFLPLLSHGQVQLAKFFSENMVLQREKPIHIWGKGIPGHKVTVSFLKTTTTSIVESDSSWNVYFKKQKANSVGQSLLVSDENDSIELQNILIGDIWICSGQSNMEWPMSREMHFKEEAKNTNQPLIRIYNPIPAGRFLYHVVYADSLTRRMNTNDYYGSATWLVCDSNSIKPMSAIGYYFAKAITGSEKIPIGLINLSIGGAPIETFISREALQQDKKFAKKVQGDWLTNESLPLWARERGRQNVGANKNGYGDDLGLNHGYKPGFAYASGIAPITGMPIKGILWYQGESNSQEPVRVNEFRELIHLLINSYRKKWQDPAMPFYWVQLSSIDTIKYKSHYWPQFRDEQRKLLNEVTNGGMAVTSDVGFKDDVHPTDKKTVGERLARWALYNAYKKNIVPSGPLPIRAKYSNGKIIVSFQYTANGLKVSDGKSLRGFSIDGTTETEAIIQNNTIVIKVNEKPAFIYYAWKPFTDANLVNSELLPASTFKIQVE